MESKGRLVLIAIAGVIVAFGAISVYKKMAGSKDAPLVEKSEPSSRILVANRDLTAGQFLDIAQDVTWQGVEPDTITSEYIREGQASINSFAGAVIRRSLHAGDRVTSDALMKSGEGGFMSAVLEPGHRAVSVSVNATSGNAGFISPGDHVDMIVTRHLRSGGSNNDEEIISETFVEDVRVLAVDQSLDNPENKAILAKTVTLEVTSEQAEKVAVASELGKISLALRSLAPVPPGTKPVEQKKEDLMSLYNDSMQQKAPDSQVTSRIRVIRGDQVEHVEMK